MYYGKYSSNEKLSFNHMVNNKSHLLFTGRYPINIHPGRN